MSCTECANRNPSVSHCPTCHVTWTAYRHAHCRKCHQHFTSDTAARLHQRFDADGRLQCVDAETAVHKKSGDPIYIRKAVGWGLPPSGRWNPRQGRSRKTGSDSQ